MANRIDFLARIDALVLEGKNHPFFSRYTEDLDLAMTAIARESKLQLYTLTAWGDEVWVHRGLRTINRLGFLVGRMDLGPDFKELLWTEPYSD